MKCKTCRRIVDRIDVEGVGHWIYDGCKRFCRGPVKVIRKNVTISAKEAKCCKS